MAFEFGGPGSREAFEAQKVVDTTDIAKRRADTERETLEKNAASERNKTAANINAGKELFKDAFVQLTPEQLKLERQKEIDTGYSQDTKDVLTMRREKLSGLTAEEKSAQSGQAAEAFGRNEETNRRRLAGVQAGLGVRGATAGQQQGNLLAAGQQQRTNFERDMILANRQIQDQALNAFEGSVRGAETLQFGKQQANIGIQQFNIGQELKEVELRKFNIQQTAAQRSAEVTYGLGLTQIQSATENSIRQANSTRDSAAKQSSGGGSVICTELYAQGILSDEIFRLDEEYGQSLQRNHMNVYQGYIAWAPHVVKIMKASTLFTKFVSLIAVPWANHMAYQNTTFGKIIHTFGYNFCSIIGSLKSLSNVKEF